MKQTTKKSAWSLKLSTAQIVLIPVAVGINYVGSMFAQLLKLPLWLDCIGTCLAACLGGPIVGGIAGAINNIIQGLTVSPISFLYAFTQIGIGIVVGYFAKKGKMEKVSGAVTVGILAGLTAVCISSVLNIALWGGQSGNIWGDALFALLVANNIPFWMAAVADEMVTDIPDKIIVLLVTFSVLKGLPTSLKAIFENASEETHSLD